MSKEKPVSLKIECPMCTSKTTMTYVQDYKINDKHESDKFALNNTEDVLEPEMTGQMYDILKNIEPKTRIEGVISSIGKHRIGGLLSKPCKISEKFVKIFNYYYMDHENQIGGYTFRFIEEMLPMMKQGQLTFVANNDKIRKSVGLVEKGVELRNLEKYDEAVACYNEALEIYPENSSAWSSLGVILRILGKPEESISYYDKALGFDSGDYVIWANKGRALIDLEKYKEALACYDEAIKLEPNNSQLIEFRQNILDELEN